VGPGFVDGGIIGPPARTPGTTRLYLSGSAAPAAAAWFSAGPLQAIVLDGGPGAASALKMAYAAYTKGLSALVLAVRALAEAEGITPALLAEWALSQPGLTERSVHMARATAPKAWRFADEMHEIADTFAAAALPDGFHRAAAEIYRRLAQLKDAPDAALEDVLELLGRAEPPTPDT
jgi:3-hydroxyisobutyrate dehydrogenase-like beta-hydroxyacid dehydrogenase